jgi:hypothetical protein
MNPYPSMEPMSTKASRISNTGGRKWINQSATKGNMNIRSKRASRDRDNKSTSWNGVGQGLCRAIAGESCGGI